MDLLFAILAGFLAGLVPYGVICRKLWILQCDLAATQNQLLKDRNARAAQIRHSAKDDIQELLFKNGQDSHKSVAPDPMAKFRRV